MSSPLRYAGGKSKQTSKILRYLKGVQQYREPFVGGGSVYLASLRKTGGTETSWINDLDPLIYNFWLMVRDGPEELIRRFEDDTTIIDHGGDEERIKIALQRFQEVKDGAGNDPPGYRALFLNKTCFSGILTGGPTGGTYQTGLYQLKSRWAKDKTIQRIRIAHKKMQGCLITNLDFEEVISPPGENVGIYCDPPYLHKGSQCYEYSFELTDHTRLANAIIKSGHRFVITVDNCPEIKDVWMKAGIKEPCFVEEEWPYSMTDYRDRNRIGKELFIIDDISKDFVNKQKRKQFYD